MGLATDGNTVFVVGQYSPAGNISNMGFFEKNVLPAGTPAQEGEQKGRPGEETKPQILEIDCCTLITPQKRIVIQYIFTRIFTKDKRNKYLQSDHPEN